MSIIVNKRTRSFCMTIFDYEQKINFVQDFFEAKTEYGCYGKELTKSGKEHLQCFYYLKNAKTVSAMLKFFKKTCLEGAHLEFCKGSLLENRLYCVKELGDFYEFGTPPKPGERKDLSATRNLLLNTGKMRDIVEQTENLQSIRVCEKYLSYHETARDWKPYVTWIFGRTGVGKSRVSRRFCDPNDTWVSDGPLKWWEGYDAHKYVILDDFRGSHCTFEYLLRILDRYGMRVECKGGARQLLATHIFVTSDRSPEECYRVENERIDQLLRRIDSIVNLKKCTEVSAQRSGVILSPDLLNEIMDFGFEKI